MKGPSSQEMIWDATLILEAERRGISTAQIQELLAREGVRPIDLTQYLEHLLDEGPCGAGFLAAPPSSSGSKLKEMRLD
jgi:hypothetical protein